MESKNTIIRLIFLSILIQLALSEPDLCKNPNLNSITFIPDYNIWFFTSDGYYWLVNDTDFPPGPPAGKLPEGFSRGDASYYCDFKKVCANSGKRTQQLLYLVEKLSSGNKIIEFDIENRNWSTSVETFSSDKIVGRANIIGKDSEEIEAIFSLRDTDVYVVKQKNYAAVNWKELCSQPNGYSKGYDPKSSDDLQSPKLGFDAITVKDKFMYTFIGTNFWRSAINFGSSTDGNIHISRGGIQNTSTDFFKFTECQQITVKQTEIPIETTEQITVTEESHVIFGKFPFPYSKLIIILVLVIVMLIVFGVIIIGLVLYARLKKIKAKQKPKVSNK